MKKLIVRKIHSLHILISVVIFMFGATASANTAEVDGTKSAEDVVGYLQQSLIEAMRKGEQLDHAERVAFLAPVIEQTHDFDRIIKTIIGSTLWHQMDQSQQNLIIETFRKLSIATYAGQFKEFSGEQFKLLEQRDLPRDQKLVRSQLVTDDGEVVSFDYVLHRPDGHWRVINILFDGVSDLAIKRSEYRSIMQRKGFQSLIDMLNVKISEAESE